MSPGLFAVIYHFKPEIPKDYDSFIFAIGRFKARNVRYLVLMDFRKFGFTINCPNISVVHDKSNRLWEI